MDNKSILEKIISEVSTLSGNNRPEFVNGLDWSSVVFYSTMKPEMIIETAKKYLHIPYYSIFIRLEQNDIKFVCISIYKSGEKEVINFGVNRILSFTELDNGFIYKYCSAYSNSTCYMCIPNFDVIMEKDRPSRKREILTVYCKLLSYDTINRLYKKYTGRGISESIYLKYNLE